MKRISLSIDDELHKQVQRAADGESASAWIRRAVKEKLARARAAQ